MLLLCLLDLINICKLFNCIWAQFPQLFSLYFLILFQSGAAETIINASILYLLGFQKAIAQIQARPGIGQVSRVKQ